MAFPIRSIDFFLTRKSYRATLLKKNLEINSSYPKKKKKKKLSGRKSWIVKGTNLSTKMVLH